MNNDTRGLLERSGVTPADYKTILASNPFAQGASAVDTKRFIYKGPILYQPPRQSGGEPITTKGTWVQSLSEASSSSATNSYDVKVSVEAGTSFGDAWEAKIKASSQWTWTDSEKMSDASGRSDKADMVVIGPPYGYMGPQAIDVYYDVLYRTFMFHPAQSAVTLTGRVISRSSSDNVGSIEVTLLTDARTYRTFTDQDGNFAFNRPLRGGTQLRVGGVKRTLNEAELRRGRLHDLAILVP